MELQCGGWIGDDQIKNLPGVMSKLSVLKLEESDITDEGVRHIANQCTSLVELSLFGCKGVSDTALLYIAAGAMPDLRKLDLNSCKHITPIGIQFVRARCPHIKELWSQTPTTGDVP